jgi:hypothetical protein
MKTPEYLKGFTGAEIRGLARAAMLHHAQTQIPLQ